MIETMRCSRGAAAGHQMRLPQDGPEEKPLRCVGTNRNKGFNSQQSLHNRSSQSRLAVAAEER